MTTDALAPRPTVWPRATRAPATCRGPASPRSWRVSSTTCPRAEAPRGSPLDSSPPLGFTGRRPPRPVAPSSSSLAASPRGRRPREVGRRGRQPRVLPPRLEEGGADDAVGQLLHAEHEDGVVLTGANGARRQHQGGTAAGTTGLDVDDRHPRHPESAEHLVARG